MKKIQDTEVENTFENWHPDAFAEDADYMRTIHTRG